MSAKWEVRVKVVDSKYVGREDIYLLKYKGDDYLVLGQNAKYARVWHDGHWNRYQNKTYVKLKRTEGVQAYSESYQMRYNYFNYTAEK